MADGRRVVTLARSPPALRSATARSRRAHLRPRGGVGSAIARHAALRRGRPGCAQHVVPVQRTAAAAGWSCGMPPRSHRRRRRRRRHTRSLLRLAGNPAGPRRHAAVPPDMGQRAAEDTVGRSGVGRTSVKPDPDGEQMSRGRDRHRTRRRRAARRNVHRVRLSLAAAAADRSAHRFGLGTGPGGTVAALDRPLVARRRDRQGG